MVIAIGLVSLACSIPVLNRDAPAGLKYDKSKTMLPEPVDYIRNLDNFCQYVYQDWWTEFRERRKIATEVWLESHPLLSLIPKHYTDYSDKLEDIPVEAINAVAIVPALSGFYEGIYRCSGGCQDIRTTAEVVVARLIDKGRRPQQRAKQSFSIPCRAGTKSETYRKLSKRQYAPPASEASALAWTKLPELDIPAEGYALEGDKSIMVTGCECVPETEADRVKLEALNKTRHKHAAKQQRARDRKKAEATSRPQTTKTGKPRGRPPKRPRPSDEGPSGIIPEEQRATLPPPVLERAVADNREQATCHDFDYPQLPHATMDSREQDDIDPLAETLEVVQAQLQFFAGQQVFPWEGSGASSSGGKG